MSGPVSRGERAKMHCFRLATAERPHSSLKDTMAFCKKEFQKMQLSLRASLQVHTSKPKIGQLNDRKIIFGS